ncbi:polysaccharide biosynthesis C-terminal domain-containing protein [Pseudokineococcus marinus]|nr:polysaccharide biosynthesis C-terminal domain-containing protein [Pseudokineococcus marinus]
MSDGAAPPPRPGGGEREVVRSGLWRVAATVLPMVSALALSVVVSRVLGAEGLGLQSLLSYVQALVLNTFVLSLTQAGIQLLSAARGAGDDRSLHWLRVWSLRAHVVTGVVLAAGLLGLGALRDEPLLLWGVIAGTALVDALAYALTVRVVAFDGWSRVSQRRLVSQGAGPLLGVVAVLGGLGVTGVFVGQAVGSLYLLGALLVLQRRVPGTPRAGPPVPLRPVARLWLGFVASLALAQVVERRVELVFIDLFGTARDVGLFAACFTLVSVAVAVMAAVTGAAMPAVARTHAAGGADRLSAVVGRALRVLLAVGVVLVAGFLALGPSLLVALYGASFGEAAPLLRGLCLLLLPATTAGALGAYWLGTGRVAVAVRAAALAALVDVGACLALVPGLGAAGAVVAAVSAQVAYAGALLVASRDLPPVRDLRVGVLLRPAVAAGVAGLVAGAVAAATPPWVAVPLGAVAFAVVLLLLAPRVGVLGRDDAAWLAGVLPARTGGLALRLARRA